MLLIDKIEGARETKSGNCRQQIVFPAFHHQIDHDQEHEKH